MIVIGNGQSRKKVNLNNYNELKIGCNAIIRDYHVDHLVCCDKKMVKQALALGYSPVYTRDRWASDFDSPDVFKLPDLPSAEITVWTNLFIGEAVHMLYY